MRKNKGFTLIELMIVIAIVGILAAVAIPKFVELQHNSKRQSQGFTYNYIVKVLGSTGQVTREYRVKDYSEEAHSSRVTLYLEDGRKVIVSGTYTIEEAK